MTASPPGRARRRCGKLGYQTSSRRPSLHQAGVQDAWAGASEWSRDSEFLSELAATLGLTDMEIDRMFLVAAGIRS